MPSTVTAPVAALNSGPDGQVALLTTGMARGDEMAWREFHALYFDRLLRYLLVVTGGSEENAREALQQTLIRVCRHARRFDREEVFWSWLTVLARSAVVDGTRRRSRYATLLAGYARELLGHPPEPVPDTRQMWEAGLNRALAELSPEERGLLTAKYQESQTMAEIATQTGMTPRAVESRLGRIRAELRTRLLRQLRHEESP